MADPKTTITYLAERLHEKSTYLLIPIILGAVGVNASDLTYQTISQLVLAISGLLLVLLPESNSERTITLGEYISKRLAEPTTYAAIPLLIGMIGIHIDNEIIQKISTGGIAAGGLLAALLAERPAPEPLFSKEELVPMSSVASIPVSTIDQSQK